MSASELPQPGAQGPPSATERRECKSRVTLLLRDADSGQIDHMAAESTHWPHHPCTSSSWLGARGTLLAIGNFQLHGGSSTSSHGPRRLARGFRASVCYNFVLQLDAESWRGLSRRPRVATAPQPLFTSFRRSINCRVGPLGVTLNLRWKQGPIGRPAGLGAPISGQLAEGRPETAGRGRSPTLS